MKTQNVLIFLFTLLLLILNSCGKEMTQPDVLPKATQSGKDIFACMLNDTAWIAEGEALGASIENVSASYDESGTYVHGANLMIIRGTKFSEWATKSERFKISLEPVLGIGLIDVNTLEEFSIEYETEKQFPTGEPRIKVEYHVDEDLPIEVNITKIDTLENICSGDFKLELVNIENDLDRITVTRGRFDAVFRTY